MAVDRGADPFRRPVVGELDHRTVSERVAHPLRSGRIEARIAVTVGVPENQPVLQPAGGRPGQVEPPVAVAYELRVAGQHPVDLQPDPARRQLERDPPGHTVVADVGGGHHPTLWVQEKVYGLKPVAAITYQEVAAVWRCGW